MKKITLFAGLLSLGLLAGPAATVSAADTSATSNAEIKFHENTNPTDPIDPGDTDTPTGMAGPLSLDLVPSLNFGDNILKAKTNFTDEGAHKIQVTDGRSAGTGWTVTLAAGPFTSGGSTLTGAELSAKATTSLSGAVNGALDSSIDTTGINTLAVANLAADGSGTTANIFTGAVGTSSGTWQATYAAKDYSLMVPTAAQTSGDFTAQLTWTINDGPAS